MQHISLKIDHLGIGVPDNVEWTLHDRLKMQRLYYIIDGSGFYKDKDGAWQKMQHGKIYVFPYNFYAEFKTDANDVLKHLYFDFTSNPPVIGTSPAIYDVEEGSKLYHLVRYIEALMSEFDLPRMTRLKVPHITDSKNAGFDEERQVIYYALYQLILTLTHIKALPFLEDRVVSDTIKYIREHIASELTIDVLAQRAGFQSNYFIRYFSKIMNESPHTYIKSYRLITAQGLIAGGLSYEEASKKVGYKNGKSLWQAMHKYNKEHTADI